jgi:methyl-accepting chemotaxis protein
MKVKYKLTLINGLLMAVFITGITSVILNRAGALQRAAAVENMTDLSANIGKEILGLTEVCIQVLNTTALFTCYENVPAEARRAGLQTALYMLVSAVPEFVSAYTLWMPDAFDGLDALYAGTPGSTGNGQFAFYVTKALGAPEFKAYPGYDGALTNLPTDIMVTNPMLDTAHGSGKYLIDIQIPILRGDTVGGILGLQVGLEGTQAAAEKIKPYGVGNIAVYANNGAIAAHFDSAKPGSNFRTVDLELLGEDGVLTVAESLSSGKTGVIFHRDMVIMSYPFKSTGSDFWTVVSFVPANVVFSPVYVLIEFSIVFIVIAVAAAAVIIFFVSTGITKPIVTVALTLKDISEGEGNLTETVNVNSKDEIGELAYYFNATLGKIRNMIVTISNQSDILLNIGDDLARQMNETAAAVNEIAANIQNAKDRTGDQSVSVSKSITAMEQITGNIGILSGHVERQSTSVSQSSSAIEEMLASIQSVARTLMNNAGNVKELMESSDDGRAGIQEVVADIQEIARESEGLLEINAVMENISSQTNLLSMNAAIEAAHAGEAGKGFAVVADEIRKLAENSGEQSKIISTVLKKIKDSIDKITESTDNVLKKFEAIENGVKTVSNQEESIRNAMEEQSAGSQQILAAIGQLNDTTQVVKNGSDEMLGGSRLVIAESKNLEVLTSEIAGGMNEMAVGAEQINTAVNRVNLISGENRNNIVVLADEIKKFKVE